MKVLKSENSKLIQEVLDSQKNFNSYLKNHDTSIISDVLKNLIHQLSNFSRNFERSISHGYHSDDHLSHHHNHHYKSSPIESSPSPDDENDKVPSISNNLSINVKKLNIPPVFKNPQLKSPLRQCHDVRLHEWLSRNGFDEETKNIIDIADFTYEDLLYITDKDDIWRIGLRVGTSVRLWKSIQAHRKRYGTYQAELRGEQLSNGFSNDLASNNSYDSNSSSSYDTCNSSDMATM